MLDRHAASDADTGGNSELRAGRVDDLCGGSGGFLDLRRGAERRQDPIVQRERGGPWASRVAGRDSRVDDDEIRRWRHGRQESRLRRRMFLRNEERGDHRSPQDHEDDHQRHDRRDFVFVRGEHFDAHEREDEGQTELQEMEFVNHAGQ